MWIMFEGMEVPELFMNLLEEDDAAMGYFKMLPEQEKERLIRYIDEARTGDEARKRIDEIRQLARQEHNHYPPLF